MSRQTQALLDDVAVDTARPAGPRGFARVDGVHVGGTLVSSSPYPPIKRAQNSRTACGKVVTYERAAGILSGAQVTNLASRGLRTDRSLLVICSMGCRPSTTILSS